MVSSTKISTASQQQSAIVQQTVGQPSKNPKPENHPVKTKQEKKSIIGKQEEYMEIQKLQILEIEKLDRKFAIELNGYLSELEEIFQRCSMKEMGKDRMGFQVFLKLIKDFNIMESNYRSKDDILTISMTSATLIYTKLCASNSKIDF